MSINGVNNPLLNALNTLQRPGSAAGVRPGQLGGAQPSGAQPSGAQPGAIRPGVARPAATPAAPALKPQQSLAAPAQTRPAEAPAGTVPALWCVLTTEERAFFAKAATSGPLTYGRAAAGINGNPMAQTAPASRGGRLDVRA